MCDIFKSLTYHIMVICFPSIILLATHQSYGFILNPHSVDVNSFVSFSRKEAMLVIFRKEPLPARHIYFFGHFWSGCISCIRKGQVLLRISIVLPSSFIWVVSPSMSDYTKASGMSTVAISRFSIASMMHVRSTAYMDTVDELTSSLSMQRRCLRPSAQPLPLILPHLFYF